MILAMLLAHLLGDYILQWDALANWKSRELKGVIVHGAIVSSVAVTLAAFFDVAWWPWAVFIGLTHTAIDAAWLWFGRHFRPRAGLYSLFRLTIDQAAHLSVIAFALFASRAIEPRGLIGQLGAVLATHRVLVIALGYAFVMMPAWILIEFTTYGLINKSAPDFSHAIKNKYIGSLERSLMTTFVLLGQFMLVPIVALPRLIFDSPRTIGQPNAAVYLAEWLASLAVAVLIGLGLKAVVGS